MRYLILLASIAALLTASCASTSKKGPITATNSMSAAELLAVSRDSSEKAQKAKSREQQRNWALHGISVAEQCLMRAPEEPGCYYYRAINTGLYHEVKVVGYQKGVKQMIEDCKKVIELDPKYDHGGAYRILGQIYTKLPQTGGRPDSITRDLEKAEDYLKQALRIAPGYPENHIFYAETLLEQDRTSEASSALLNARELTPRWKQDNAYESWQITMKDLERKLTKSK